MLICSKTFWKCANCVSGTACKVFRRFSVAPDAPLCWLFWLSRLSRCFLAPSSELCFVFSLYWFWWHVKAVWTQFECKGSYCLLSEATILCVCVHVCLCDCVCVCTLHRVHAYAYLALPSRCFHALFPECMQMRTNAQQKITVKHSGSWTGYLQMMVCVCVWCRCSGL